ncbi:MAG: hypothetical protein PHW75_01815 [Patescibacteria group bacterium]|nr:hypothetical protein [Patescibacteria group bacterium]
MMTLTHTLMGSVAGVYIESYPVAFMAGIILHLLTDKLKHYWPGEREKNLLLMLVDWPIAIAFLVHLLYLGEMSIFWGGFGGIVIDFVAIAIPVVQRTKISRWHNQRQPHTKDIRFLALDLFAITVLIIILRLV